jgi:hypothetical protein
MNPNKAPWPVSNDDFAMSYVESSLRTETEDYQKSPNRVSLVIGEGSFNTSILYMPEDTIILADISPGACDYMHDYVRYLRYCQTPEAWLHEMASSWQSKTYHMAQSINEGFEHQAKRWNRAGYTYSLTHEATYSKAHEAALSKAIVPWRMDITDPMHLLRLAELLGNANATITFANITNLIDIVYGGKPEHAAKNLDLLPFSAFAPILAKFVHVAPEGVGGARSLSGPYFGVNNIRFAA